MAKTSFSFMHLFFVVVVRINKVHLTTATASFLSYGILLYLHPVWILDSIECNVIKWFLFFFMF